MRNKPIHNETPATFTPGFSFSGSPVESGRLDEPTSQVSIHFPPMSDTDDEDDAFFFDAVYDPMVSDPNPKEAFGAGDSPRFDGTGILLQFVEREGYAPPIPRREFVERFQCGSGELDFVCHGERRRS